MTFAKTIRTNMTIATAVSLFIFMFAAPLFVSPAAKAAPVDVLEKCDAESKVCKGTDKNSVYKLLTNVINILLSIIGSIAVIMIIVGGIRYTTSNGDSNQAKAARDTIIYSIVGLVIAIMSFAIVNWVLSRL